MSRESQSLWRKDVEMKEWQWGPCLESVWTKYGEQIPHPASVKEEGGLMVGKKACKYDRRSEETSTCQTEDQKHGFSEVWMLCFHHCSSDIVSTVCLLQSPGLDELSAFVGHLLAILFFLARMRWIFNKYWTHLCDRKRVNAYILTKSMYLKYMRVRSCGDGSVGQALGSRTWQPEFQSLESTLKSWVWWHTLVISVLRG